MRSLLALAIGLGVPVATALFLACGPPSSFDYITGGADSGPPADADAAPITQDDLIEPPRPLAPLSTSWVNGSRPRWRWDLSAPGSIGARVVLCRDPRCVGEKKTFSAAGRDLVAPEDLAPGLWFWHLVSTTPTAFGTKKSPTWSLYVRGGTGPGTPAGSFVDLNGDGRPDLLAQVYFTAADGKTERSFYALLGTKDDDPSRVSEDFGDFTATPAHFVESASSVVTTGDIDGDGVSDIIIGDETPTSGTPPTIVPYIDLRAGDRDAGFDPGYRLLRTPLPNLESFPRVVSPGDLDGDGHADVYVSTKLSVLSIYGAKDGLSAFGFADRLPTVPPPPDAGVFPFPTAAIPGFGYDFDGDGLMDFVAPTFEEGTPFFIDRALPGRRAFEVELNVRIADASQQPAPPTLFASGDVDGDGTNDLVFLTSIATKPSVCVFAGAEDTKNAKLACWTPDPTPPGFASAIVTADVDGLGKDEILVGSAEGVDILSLPQPGQLTADHIATKYGSSLTVLNPGRPMPATWAAMKTDGASLAIFQGKTEVRAISPPPPFGAGETSKFGPSIR